MSDAQQNRERCQALRVDGQPCTAPAVRNGRCIGHQGADNAAWRARGGAGTSNANRAVKLLPARLAPVLAGLERAFAGIEKGTFDPKRAMIMATLAVAIVRVVQAGEFELRVRTLEQQADEAGRFGHGLPGGKGPTRWPTLGA
jgi:Family of unknown function (DUF5763)